MASCWTTGKSIQFLINTIYRGKKQVVKVQSWTTHDHETCHSISIILILNCTPYESLHTRHLLIIRVHFSEHVQCLYIWELEFSRASLWVTKYMALNFITFQVAPSHTTNCPFGWFSSTKSLNTVTTQSDINGEEQFELVRCFLQNVLLECIENVLRSMLQSLE